MESTSGLDLWTFVVALVSALLALLALAATVWFGYRQIRLAQEQLTLARKEAERHAILEVSEMRLHAAKEYPIVAETAHHRQLWLDKLAWYKQAKREWDERIRKGYSPGLADVGPQDPNRSYDPHTGHQQRYDGPFPDMVLRVTLVNKGETAAHDVSGQLYFDPKYLESLNFPDMDGNVEDDKANLYTSTGSTLLPAPTSEELTFDVALLVKQPGTTHVRYAFATPQGDHIEDRWSLDVPPPT